MVGRLEVEAIRDLACARLGGREGHPWFTTQNPLPLPTGRSSLLPPGSEMPSSSPQRLYAHGFCPVGPHPVHPG